jgi:hypothetical protein
MPLKDGRAPSGVLREGESDREAGSGVAGRAWGKARVPTRAKMDSPLPTPSRSESTLPWNLSPVMSRFCSTLNLLQKGRTSTPVLWRHGSHSYNIIMHRNYGFPGNSPFSSNRSRIDPMPANIEIKARARNFADLRTRAEALSDSHASGGSARWIVSTWMLSPKRIRAGS